VKLRSALRWLGRCATVVGAAGLAAQPATAAGPGVQGSATPAPMPAQTMTADEVILQFRRPELKAALLQAPRAAPARAQVQRALDALGQRQGVALHYLQTLGVGSALVAVTPAAARAELLDARVLRLAADAEVESVELNARMAHFRPAAR
jgi:hypothetical protein